MKLDFDIVRKLLLEIEEKTTLNTYLNYCEENCSQEEIYALQKLFEANFLNFKNESTFTQYSYTVTSITWLGHEFLDNIRSPKAVQHTKNVIKQIGSASIQIMSQVAAAYLKNQFGL